ncbi:hypothetical protein GQ43DRAFT_81893 [Delitschia confertaspora ATCC 74209]|uniref:Mitochondrial distribution and morphology protein 34 n=1 Tax=Delitschia confertaspora ATCC 74209 TaxID=1513339 RepID=A0A9P4MUL7_9PLEO|nr:hypothetical protein GQ43DRAFT_81893 [Delitschia confertaspora ATCC 74209]
MAFNFNWSPLIADTSRARDMLTAALNKSPKPPIIVDDIIVNELNLGSTPPELEILEIGDLAEDRFRGIFKMSYTGDAFLTLKTKVQANPLNTYLSAKPDFASPQPLAAASGLTIPLQITLSDIKLSGFVILVFSKQKGLTLVFRNDPLESLKVSSTFDSIPFVRDYLQKEIEGQLRVLFMEDLPAIIHRLSLRLWSPEFQELELEKEEEERLDSSRYTTVPVDPLTTPPQDAVDAFGNPLDESQISDLSLDPTEVHASFSQKNILRLAALSGSNHTLSLFTPGIRDAVFRAWTGPSERLEAGINTPPLTLSSLSRIQSSFGSIKSHASSVASDGTGNETVSSRPSLSSYNSVTAGLNLGANRGRPTRRRKKRVVNLRKDRTEAESSELPTPAPSASVSEATESVLPEEEDLDTPPKSPTRGTRFELDIRESAPVSNEILPSVEIPTSTPILSGPPKSKSRKETSRPSVEKSYTSRPPLAHTRLQATSPLLRSLSFDRISSLSASSSKGPLSPNSCSESTSGGILEQAWMQKMAMEIARKVQHEKDRVARGESPRKAAATGGMWESDEVGEAPPAYVA